MQKITTFLTYNVQAQEAVNLYTAAFKNSKIVKTTYYGQGAPIPKGKVLSIIFQLNGQEYIALNGGPHFSFSEGISLFVHCETQQEVDELWEKLSEGGKKGSCGWLKDPFGVSWQIIPGALNEMLQDKDTEKSKRVMQAMLKMTKIDINLLQQAYAG